MKIILLSLELVCYGYFCDVCASVCTKIAETRIGKKKPLNKKMLVYLSNLSNNSLKHWQRIEHNFICMSLNKK